jgi:AcrR family transcriptional regulator
VTERSLLVDDEVSPSRIHPARGSASQLARIIDVEAEFDQFVTGLIPMAARDGSECKRSTGQRRRPGPPPSISAETIFEHALEVLDQEGPAAVTVRRIAADLKISTRTLYKRIGNHDNMIRNVIALYYCRLNLEVRKLDSWESTAMSWCMNLYRELSAHPHVTALMTVQHGATLRGYVDELLKATLQEGISRERAVECCRSLVNLTVNDAIVNARGSSVLETARLALALALVEASNVRATKPSAASRWA